MPINRRINLWELRYQWAKALERAELWAAFHAPRWLVYWCVIRAYGTAWRLAGDKEPDELTYSQVVGAVYATDNGS